mgnify:CR=1 FL=1
MHAIQTSGNCIRNVTSDPLAGATDDEVENPLVWCEVIRQWSTLHPEFAFLPRKFKIAVSAGAEDRAATGFHDIGLRLVKARSGEVDRDPGVLPRESGDPDPLDAENEARRSEVDLALLPWCATALLRLLHVVAGLI